MSPDIITQRMPNVFHVRLIGSLPQRVEPAQRMCRLSASNAATFVRNEDCAHSRYARAHFHARPSDEHLYHLMVNTDDLPMSEAARMVAVAALAFFRRSGRRTAWWAPGAAGRTLAAGGVTGSDPLPHGRL